MTPELSQAYAAAEIATEKVARLTERVRELSEALEDLWKQGNRYKDGECGYASFEDTLDEAQAALAKREGSA